MDISQYMKILPFELQNKIYHMSFEGRANKIFKEFIKENELFKYNFNLQNKKYNINYTLFTYLKDIKFLKSKKMFMEGIIFDIDEVMDFIVENHINMNNGDEPSDSSGESDSDYSDSSDDESDDESD